MHRLSNLSYRQLFFSLTRPYVENQAVHSNGNLFRDINKKELPIPVTVVKKDDLFRNVSTNSTITLSNVPGVTQVTTGPAISKPLIRGLGGIIVARHIKRWCQTGRSAMGDEHGLKLMN
mgnify:CR=1 FL=1